MGMTGKISLGVIVGAVVIGAMSANSGDDSSASGDAKADSSASAGREAAEEHGRGAVKVAGKGGGFTGDGDFLVGTDIKPGTYRSTGNTTGMCYWERAKDASGEMDSLLANDNVSGTGYVTVTANDKIFRSSGCSDWEAVAPKEKASPATEMAGDGGMFAVGVDIAPGTYRSTGNTDDMCYWERAKDAGHTIDSITANNNVTGSAVVTISASDAYFKTSGCQDWKRTG
ncbi:hypothetical protein [Streptomyces chromofuscus]|uniref:Uncharacterized protein n=1 Tax=Streptomyces chromofuscus TaxID=42881 RepID=A0A7M2TEA8_STRCW|nr:hypothetical protein [Streptomyces chromofuscus]QOV47076.1 hypothetical protein IPT68_15065 [Streptomyces chromofuscus]GGT26170.1 hypothetical protein GCM10010254_53260 [Streptomyces chromofuscus]